MTHNCAHQPSVQKYFYKALLNILKYHFYLIFILRVPAFPAIITASPTRRNATHCFFLACIPFNANFFPGNNWFGHLTGEPGFPSSALKNMPFNWEHRTNSILVDSGHAFLPPLWLPHASGWYHVHGHGDTLEANVGQLKVPQSFSHSFAFVLRSYWFPGWLDACLKFLWVTFRARAMPRLGNWLMIFPFKKMNINHFSTNKMENKQ